MSLLEEAKLWEIARIIEEDWSKTKSGVYFGARPYLDAMHAMRSIDDNYGADTGQSVVAYFLANANTWRGETARTVKRELNRRLKEKK